MNFKYSQPSNGSNRQEYPNLHFVGNKISLRQQNRYNPPPEQYQVQSFYPSNQSNLYHGHSQDVNRQPTQQVYMVKRQSNQDNRQKLSKSSSSDSFYNTEKGPFRASNQYHVSNPVNFAVSSGNSFYSEKQMPKVTVLTRKPSDSNLAQHTQQTISSPTNVKYTQQTQQSPSYVQILHHNVVSPLRQQQGRVITFSPGQSLVNTPQSIHMNQVNIETSIIKQGQAQNDGQNRNHVSMFSISSFGAVNKGSGSEVLNQRGHLQQNEQLMSNVSNFGGSMNPSSVNISTQHAALSRQQVIHYPNPSSITNNPKPYQPSAPKQGLQQNPNTNSQLTYLSPIQNNHPKPGLTRTINPQGYNYTPLLTKASNNQFGNNNNNSNHAHTQMGNNSSSNSTSISQGLSFQQKGVNRLQKQSAMNYKPQLSIGAGSGVNIYSSNQSFSNQSYSNQSSFNQSGHVVIKRNSSQKDKPPHNRSVTHGNQQFGFELKSITTPSLINTLTSPKYAKPIDLQQTQSIPDHKYSSTLQQDFLSMNKKFSSTSNEYELKQYEKREHKNNLKQIIRNQGIVDKLEGKINSFQTQIYAKNGEISRLKKDSAEKALEIISLNRELDKYRAYEKTLTFKQRQAKSLSFHQPHSQYSSNLSNTPQKPPNPSSHLIIQQPTSHLISQSPKPSQRPIQPTPHLSNTHYTSRASKTLPASPSVQNYNHIQNLNQKLLQQIEKMEKELKQLREGRLLRENEGREGFRSNGENERTMKLILAQKIDLEQKVAQTTSKLNCHKQQITTLQITHTQLQSKTRQQQQRITQLSNQLISKQQYIIYLSQQKSTLSQTNQKSSHKFLVQIQDQKDTINVLKKLNQRQKLLAESQKDKLREKDLIVSKLNEEISLLSGENERLGKEVNKWEQVINNKESIITDLQGKINLLQVKIKQHTLRQNQLIGRQKQSLSNQKLLQQKLSHLQSTTLTHSRHTQQLFKLTQTNHQLLLHKKTSQHQLKLLKQQANKHLQELTLKAKEILQLKQENKLIDQRAIEARNSSEQMLGQVKGLKEENNKLRGEMAAYLNCDKSEANSLSEELKKVKDQNVYLKQEVSKYTGETITLKQQLQKQKDNNTKLVDQLNMLKHQNSKHQTSYKVLQKQLKDLNYQISQQKHLVTQLKPQITYLQRKNAQLTNKHNKLVKEHQLLTDKFSKLTNECDELKNEKTNLQNTNTQLNEKSKQSANTINQLKNQITQLINTKSTQTTQIQSLTSKANQLTHKLTEQSTKSSSLNSQLNSHLSTITSLKQQLQQKDSQINQNQILTSKQQKQIFQLKTTHITLTTTINTLKDSLNNTKQSQNHQHTEKIHLVSHYLKEVALLTKLVETKNQQIEKSHIEVLQVKKDNKKTIELMEEKVEELQKQLSLTNQERELIVNKLTTQSTLIQQKVKQLSLKITQLQKQKTQLKKEATQLTKDKQLATNKLKEQISTINKSHQQQLSSSKKQLTKQYEQNIQQIQKTHKQELDFKSKLMQKMEKQLMAIKQKIQSSKQSQKLQQKSTNLKIQELYKENQVVNKKNVQLIKENQSLSKKVKQLQKQVTKLNINISSSKKLQSSTKKEQNPNSQTSINSNTNSNSKKGETVGQLTASIQHKIKQITTLKKQLTKQQESFKALTQQHKSLQQSSKQSDSSIVTLKKQNQKLTQLNEQLTSSLSEKQLILKQLSTKLNQLSQYKTKVSEQEQIKQNELIVLQESIELLKKQLAIYEQKYKQQLNTNQKHIQSANLIEQTPLQQRQEQQLQPIVNQIIDSSLQDDKPLSPSTIQQLLTQPTQPLQQPQHPHQQLTQQQLQHMISSLRLQAEQLKQKQLILNNKQEELNQKQQLLEDRALQVEEKEIQVEELYAQVKEQVQHLKSQFIDSSQVQQSVQDQENTNELNTQPNKKSSQSLHLTNLQPNHQQQQQQISFIQIDKNALIYICQLLAIPPIQGQLLTSIISRIQSIAPRLPLLEEKSSKKKQLQKSPKSMSTSLLKSDRKKNNHKELVKIISDFQALHDSIVVGSDEDQNMMQSNKCQTSKSLIKSKTLRSPKNSSKSPTNNPQRRRALSKQSNPQPHLSPRSLQTIPHDPSSHLINKSQIFSQKLIPQLQQQYIQILQLFQVSPQKTNHHQLLINEIVSIKQTIKMLLEEVKKGESEREAMERELRDERRRVGVIVQESAKDIGRMTKDVAKLQLDKDSLTMMNNKLQEQIHFITHQLIAIRISSMLFLNPEKYQNQPIVKISSVQQNQKSIQNQSLKLNHFKESYISVSDLTDQQMSLKQPIQKQSNKKRKSSQNSANHSLNLHPPQLKPKIKSQNDLNEISSGSYKSIEDQKPSSLKDKSKKKKTTKKQSSSKDIPQPTSKTQISQLIHSLDEEINMINEINTQEINIYRKITKEQDIVQQNLQILQQLNQQTQTQQKEHNTQSQTERQDQKDEEYYDLDEDNV